MSTAPTRLYWLTAGWLAIAHVVLLFAGAALVHSLELGDSSTDATAALVTSSLASNVAGGYLQFLAFLVLLILAALLARLLRGGDPLGWMSSCIAISASAYVAVIVTTGFAAGGAALYDGHVGAPLSTVTAINDIRNVGFFLSGGMAGLFILAVSAAGRATRALPRWLAYAGGVVGVASVAAVPAGRFGATNVTTMLWIVWLLALGVSALRRARRGDAVVVGMAASPA